MTVPANYTVRQQYTSSPECLPDKNAIRARYVQGCVMYKDGAGLSEEAAFNGKTKSAENEKHKMKTTKNIK